ncbi:aldo/keto reductase, partial [Salmonella sp. E393-2]|uniref:aldo/keto reductase n=1 Tax=Salmonella sp. E393-2 TaxID=3240324 RepID=UPI00352B1C04
EDHSVEGVQRAYDRSLKTLRVDYLDLFLIHWPVPALDRYVEAWKGLVRLLEEGRVKAIGVSNFNIELTRQAIAAVGAGEISTNQIELSPYLQSRALTAYLEEQG